MNYTIIEEAEFERSKTTTASARSIDEALQATTWALARNPFVYDRAEPLFEYMGSPVHIAKTEGILGLPILMVWFSIDGEEVHMK